ncbi:MAG: ATP-binding protein [Myxococcota bacterium]
MSDIPPDPGSSVQAVLDAITWQAAVLDTDGVIRRTNRQWVAVGEAAGRTSDDVGINYLEVCDQAGPDTHATRAAAAIRSVLAGAVDRCDLEYPCHSPDAPHWFVLSVSPITEAGRNVGVLLTHQEITARRESEHDLRAFVAHAAHDLRSPLRHLATFPELLETDLGPGLKDPQRRWLTTIRRAADHMQSQLDNLLALARSRLDPLQFGVLPLADLVARRMELQREVLRAEAELDVSDAQPVVTDDKLFTVLLDNVLTNALRHARSTADLRIRVSSGVSGDGGFFVHFDDNGPGFGPVDPGHLLRPYVHGLRPSAGLGLGLSIVKQVAARLGGTVALDRSPLGGARVTILLPAREIGAEPTVPDPDTVELLRFAKPTVD